MHEILHVLWHSLEHAFLETLKLLPFLFLTYLLMEFLEHRSGNASKNWLRRSGHVGPLIGGALGMLPQCGFSAAASGLYTGRIITTGTLLAVYLSTSDEMLPLLISEGAPLPLILKLLGTKLVIGILAGFAVDLMARLLRKKRNEEEPQPQIEEMCERENCNCEDHFAISALKHTLQIALFIFLFTFAMHLIIDLIGEDTLASLILDRPILANCITALLGLIPNCAPSVVLTQLYLNGLLSSGALLSGLLVNAGIGTAILFKNNRPVKDTLRVIGLLLGIGLLAGIIIDLTPLASFLSLQ